MGCYKTIEDIAAICGGIECLIIIDIYPHFMHCVGYFVGRGVDGDNEM
jgi:hypothetical protein